MIHVPGKRHVGGCSQQLLKFKQAKIFRSLPSFLRIKNTFVLLLHSPGRQNAHNFPCFLRYSIREASSPCHPPSNFLSGEGYSSINTCLPDMSTGKQPSPTTGSCNFSSFATVKNTGALSVMFISVIFGRARVSSTSIPSLLDSAPRTYRAY